ncbi:hypothetical protein V8F20_004990 [Naviculisporaceae sp. PSN 640]
MDGHATTASSHTRRKRHTTTGTATRSNSGRPPGRPNMTVRETDYEDNELVKAWNAAKSERPLTVVPIRIREALTEKVLLHESQRTIYRMPSREIIYYVQGWITARHIASQRPSYLNGLLIHSRGQDSPTSCNQCVERRGKNALGPFLTCRVLQGVFHNSCSNCKWFDNTSACSLYTGPKPNRKRKAKEITATPAAEAAQTNGGEGGADGDNTETATAQAESAEQQQPADGDLGQENTVQTHPAYTPYDGAPSQNQTEDVSMGGTADDKQQQQHSAEQSEPTSPDQEASHEGDQATPATGSVETPRDDNEDEHGDDDNHSVDAQLAAQLLPELSRHD